jgi:hypothetical protein
MRNKTLTAAGISLLVVALVLGGIGVANAQYTTSSSGSASTVGVLPFSFLSAGELGIGSRGSDVAGLQGFLSELGYLTIPSGVAPGYFGTLTENALMAYQRAFGLNATGRFDANTKTAITAHLNGKYPSLSWAWGGSSNTSTNTSNGSASVATAGVNQGSGQVGTSAQWGYWYNGAWYPVGSTMGGGNYSQNPSLSGTAGYWLNGAFYPTGSVASSGSNTGYNSTIGNTVAQGGNGYWFNGNWYASGTGPNSNQTGTWYNGVWYPTGTANIGGGQSSDTMTSSDGYWHQGVWYPNSDDSSRAAPGYWHRGAWYPFDSSQINGYWMNGVFYPND